MPELIEVEGYRAVAGAAVGAVVAGVHAPDAWYLKGGLTAGVLHDVLGGARIVGARRHGKLLMVDLDRPPVLGLRFGMTGRLLLDGAEPGGALDTVGALLYAPAEVRDEHVRLALDLGGGRRLLVVDPRRLGGVELDPAVEDLGIDAARLGPGELAGVLAASGAGTKAVLMDQHRVAGLGNLLVDEILWRAGVAPAARANRLSPEEVARLVAAVAATLEELSSRGGSHTGDLQPARAVGASCPRCGAVLRRDTVAGRTTYWCPAEQQASGQG